MAGVLVRSCVFYCVCVWAADVALAQPVQVEASPDAPPLSELLERLDALQRRVEILERQLAASVPAPAVGLATDTGPTLPSHAAHPPESSALAPAAVAPAQLAVEQPTQYPSLRIHGFLDVNFAATDADVPDGFYMGQLVLHLASALGPKVNVFAETSFAPRTPAGPGTVPAGYATDLERGFIRYDHNDAFKLSFGRFHTPIGYWNNAYHHGLYLQTTINRPEMVSFGTIYQPVHFIGVLAEGRATGSRLGLGYSAGLGNGRASNLARAGDFGDSNQNKAVLANLYARPERVNALELGVSVYRDRITPEQGGDMDEWITSAHVAWTNESPELIAEVFNVRHTDRASGDTFNNPAFYVQGAYRLPWNRARWKPYYRFENLSTSVDDFLFRGLDMSISTLGLRYDMVDFAAFKGEYRRSTRRAIGREHAMFLQTSFTF
jgi:hypothetical protein